MRCCRCNIAIMVVAFVMSCMFVRSTAGMHAQHDAVLADARLIVEQVGKPRIIRQLDGRRVPVDGRLRFIGSIEDESGGELARWDFVCDPNPHGGASVEGAFEVEGPFDGVIVLDIPLEPVVKGEVAVKSSLTLRAATEEPGIVLELASREAAMSILVDGKSVIRHGQGPMSMERDAPGATPVRRWSVGEEEAAEPRFVPAINDRLSIKVRSRLAEGRSAIYFGRVHLVGDPADFQLRKDSNGTGGSIIPRRDGAISISVPGAGKGGSRGKKNKSPAVIRPSKPTRDKEGD